MLFTTALALSSAALVAAVPAPVVQVAADDVILYGKGRYQVMKRTEFDEITALRAGPTPPAPGKFKESLIIVEGEDINKIVPNENQKRATSIIIPNAPSDFIGWDIQMSAVVKGAPTTIGVTSGYSVANSITVGSSASLSLVKLFLDVSAHVDYSQSWTSSISQAFSGVVPAGKYGAWVTNAYTHRESGQVWTGTIGGEGEKSYYQGDSFKNKGYDGMTWVDGVISLCMGDSFPLKRCLGQGNL